MNWCRDGLGGRAPEPNPSKEHRMHDETCYLQPLGETCKLTLGLTLTSVHISAEVPAGCAPLGLQLCQESVVAS